MTAGAGAEAGKVRPATGLIAAIDTSDPAAAAALARAVQPSCAMIKLGLEFFLARGAAGVRSVMADLEAGLFLDLKLHDIPNTVAGGLRSLAPLSAAMLTVHAAGGPAMIAAARRALEQAHPAETRPRLLAVTVLTSLDAAALRSTGVAHDPAQQVLQLGLMAMENGADGLVCSPHEIAPLRAALGRAPVLVVPGIRPPGAAVGDQARVMTPEQAAGLGADWLVVGRPITGAADPADAARRIAATLA